jgi:hypothetical protein
VVLENKPEIAPEIRNHSGFIADTFWPLIMTLPLVVLDGRYQFQQRALACPGMSG